MTIAALSTACGEVSSATSLAYSPRCGATARNRPSAPSATATPSPTWPTARCSAVAATTVNVVAKSRTGAFMPSAWVSMAANAASSVASMASCQAWSSIGGPSSNRCESVASAASTAHWAPSPERAALPAPSATATTRHPFGRTAQRWASWHAMPARSCAVPVTDAPATRHAATGAASSVGGEFNATCPRPPSRRRGGGPGRRGATGRRIAGSWRAIGRARGRRAPSGAPAGAATRSVPA